MLPTSTGPALSAAMQASIDGIRDSLKFVYGDCDYYLVQHHTGIQQERVQTDYPADLTSNDYILVKVRKGDIVEISVYENGDRLTTEVEAGEDFITPALYAEFQAAIRAGARYIKQLSIPCAIVLTDLYYIYATRGYHAIGNRDRFLLRLFYGETFEAA